MYKKELSDAFLRFYEIIVRLRAPDGCPWDREQTPLSMRTDLIEEAFEAVDAISEEDVLHTREELGDVLLNTCMIGYMHEQKKDFSLVDVFTEISDKLVRRHPHVFTESEGKSQVTEQANTSEQVLNQWDRIKQNVEGRSGKSILDEVSNGLPPLMRAAKLQKKASKKGFDWNCADEVYEKITEEILEVKEAEKSFGQNKTEQNQLHLEEEIGDLLFACVNLSRKLKIDPVVALSRANKKFYNRFSYIEEKMAEKNIPMDSEHMDEMDLLWNESKSK